MNAEKHADIGLQPGTLPLNSRYFPVFSSVCVGGGLCPVGPLLKIIPNICHMDTGSTKLIYVFKAYKLTISATR